MTHLEKEDTRPNLKDCNAFGALMDKIDELQAAEKWDEAAPLIELRQEYDCYHLGHKETQS